MNDNSWLRLRQCVENYKKEKIQQQIIGYVAECIVDEFAFINFPTLKECILPPVITEEEKRKNLLYKHMIEFDNEIWKNRVKKDKDDMMYHKEQPEVKEEPIRNRHERRKLAKLIKQKKLRKKVNK